MKPFSAWCSVASWHPNSIENASCHPEFCPKMPVVTPNSIENDRAGRILYNLIFQIILDITIIVNSQLALQHDATYI